jgi:glycolate oxidase
MSKRKIPLAEIEGIVGTENVLTNPEDLYCYSYDASKLHAMPDCVTFPGNEMEVAALLRLANAHRFPVFPRGAGSGMVGAAIPEGGGLVMALRRLNRLLTIDEDEMLAVVQPGLVTGDFQKTVRARGLYYPPDPASLPFSTLGGNVAMCAGGPKAVKYGVTRDYVLGLQVVLPTGEIMRTGTRTVKGVVGYDLTRLLVGSEGTLGVFTEIILRLIPAPESERTMLAVFRSIDEAARAVSDIIKARIVPSTLELMDQATIRVVEDYLHIGLPVWSEALLLIEVDGPDCALDQEMERIVAICRQCGASDTRIAKSAAEHEQLWLARRAISPALRQLKPGKINEDVTVPRTRIPQLIRAVQALAARHDLLIVCFGHAGDGNIHTNIMLDRSDPEEAKRAEQAVEELFRTVLDLGGTLSGEHGIGIAKSPFFQWEVGQVGFDTMWRIKQALDPLNILNPGKMFVPNRAFLQSSGKQ